MGGDTMSRIYGTGILKSMLIAFRNFFRTPITVQYPYEKLVLPERARWAVAMKLDENGEHKCTGCLACEKACPDYIIKLEITTAEDRSKNIDHWRYEIGACMMCGLCVEACPFDAILMSHDYELARIDPATLSIELLTDVPAVGPKRKAAAAATEAAAPAADKAAAPADDTESAAPAAATEQGGE
jgi:NADH-quinone oxidoreductase subunit I